MLRHAFGLFLLNLIWAAPANAAQITIWDAEDWAAQSNAGGSTYTEFTDTSLASWTHTLTFSPSATSFDSADVTLRFGGTRSSTQEVWLLWDSGSAQLGTLNGSGNNAANTIISQTFAVPLSLYPAFPATTWSLTLRVTESDSSANSIFLDSSLLTVSYLDDTTNGPPPLATVPEPATLAMVGVGLVAAARRFRRR